MLKSVQLYTPVATYMYQLMCHISRQDVIESDGLKKKYVCVSGRGGGGGGDDAIKLSCAVDLESDKKK